MAIFSHGMFFWRTLKRCFLFWLGIAWRCLRISDEVWVWDDWKWRNYCPMCNPFLKEKHWVLDNEIWGDPILKKKQSQTLDIWDHLSALGYFGFGSSCYVCCYHIHSSWSLLRSICVNANTVGLTHLHLSMMCITHTSIHKYTKHSLHIYIYIYIHI